MESRLEKIFSMGINSMSLAVWLGEDRKCSAAVVGLDLLLGLSMVPAAVVGLDLLLGLSMVRRCSLNRSFNLQYIGETKRRLKDRFNEHRRTIDNPNNKSKPTTAAGTIDNPNNKSKPTTAAEHFLSSPNHTANDMLLIPIEKIFSNRDSIRKAREAYLIQKGKTIDPAGLNIREETY